MLFSQPVLMHHVLQPPNLIRGSHWIHFRMPVSSLYWWAPNWTQNSTYSLVSAEYSGGITLLVLLATVLLKQLRMQLVFLLQGCTADSCSTCYPSQPPDPFLQNCLLVGPQLVLLHGHSFAQSAPPLSCLPTLPCLKNLYSPIVVFQSWELSHRASMIPMKSNPATVHTLLLPLVCSRAVQRHLWWASGHAAFTVGVWEPPLSCCPLDISALPLVSSLLFKLWWPSPNKSTLKPSSLG